jgi:hypothetical protein
MAWSNWIPGFLQRPAPAVVPPLGTLTVDEYLMHRDADQRYSPEFTPVIALNAADLVARVNRLLGQYGKTPDVNSGWRPAAVNRAVGGAPSSAHLTGQAVDLDDPAADLKAWCMAHLGVLVECGLYMEAPTATLGWIHLQSRAPASGARIFKP